MKIIITVVIDSAAWDQYLDFVDSTSEYQLKHTVDNIEAHIRAVLDNTYVRAVRGKYSIESHEEDDK